MEEIWKDLINYEDRYLISNLGRIKSKTNDLVLTPREGNDGYYRVILRIENKIKKYCQIHELVAENFLKNENPNEFKMIIHIDGNKLNNSVSNLKWGIPNNRIIQYDVNGNIIKYWGNINEILETHKNYKYSTIMCCTTGQNKSAYGYIWKKEGHSDVIGPKEKKIDNTNFLERDNYNFDTNIEHWKDIDNYVGRYRISSFGNIRSLATNSIMSPIKSDYYEIKLKKPNIVDKKFRVNILVAQHFIQKPKSDKPLVVDHIDGDKLNNNVTNLRWVTLSENSKAYHDKVAENKKVQQLNEKKELIKEWNNINEVVKHYKFDKESFKKSIGIGKPKFNNFYWQYEKRIVLKDDELEEDEIFKPIGVYKDNDLSNYEISNYGKVRNVLTKLLLNPGIGTYKTYFLIDKITKKGINAKAHLLVAHKFLDPAPENKGDNVKDKVNHKDKDKMNNHVDNLEWVTTRENNIHASGRKVNQYNIQTGELIKTFNSIADAGRAMNKENTITIRQVCNGVKKSAYGFKWTYADENDTKNRQLKKEMTNKNNDDNNDNNNDNSTKENVNIVLNTKKLKEKKIIIKD